MTTVTAPACAACDAPRAEWNGRIGLALCASCTAAATGTGERDPVLLGDILPVTAAALRVRVPAPRTGGPGDGPSVVCRSCGRRAVRHRMVGGGWVAMEPGERPAAGVPRGERWQIAGDGTAVRLRGAVPSDTCRVSHFSVCPGR